LRQAPRLAAGPTPAILLAMVGSSSALDPDALTRARALLAPPERKERMWPVLGAAGLLAASALAFATAMILAPPLTSEHGARAYDADRTQPNRP
jgi:hypothetical protein